MTAPDDASSFGMRRAWEGSTRVPGGGSAVSAALVRMTIQSDPVLAGNVKGPPKVAPASSAMMSPGRASSRAFRRSPPAGTARVFPGGGEYFVSRKTRGRSAALLTDAGTRDSRSAAGPAAPAGSSSTARTAASVVFFISFPPPPAAGAPAPRRGSLTRMASLHHPFHGRPQGQLLGLAADAGPEQVVAVADVGLVTVIRIGDLDQTPPAVLADGGQQGDLVRGARVAPPEIRLDQGIHRYDQVGALHEGARHGPSPVALEIDPEEAGGPARARIGALSPVGVETGRAHRDAVRAAPGEALSEERLGHRTADDVAAADVHDAADRSGRPRRPLVAELEGAPDPESPVEESPAQAEAPLHARDSLEPFREPAFRRPPGEAADGGSVRPPQGVRAPAAERFPAPSLELPCHLRPAEALLDQPPARLSERPAAPGIAQERHDRMGEISRIVRLKK